MCIFAARRVGMITNILSISNCYLGTADPCIRLKTVYNLESDILGNYVVGFCILPKLPVNRRNRKRM